MRVNNLKPNKGLSLSQAQSISNLCNQRAVEIGNQLRMVNNYGKYVKVDGNEYTITNGIPMPSNVVELLKERAGLYACQAFLMENIKAKDALLNNAKNETPDLSSVELPERPEYEKYEPIDRVREEYGWEQLTTNEYNDYLEAEAFASHIGQFIHDDSILNGLRNELPNIPSIEWMEIEAGKKSPVEIRVHHRSKDLLKLHEELAALHRDYEQKVNYYKAKVKNLVTEENARIAKVNAEKEQEVNQRNLELRKKYEAELMDANNKRKEISNEFEKERQKKIKEIASMRIEIDSRFQDTINIFLKQLKDEE